MKNPLLPPWKSAKSVFITLVSKEAGTAGTARALSGVLAKHDTEIVKYLQQLDDLGQQFDKTSRTTPVPAVEKIVTAFSVAKTQLSPKLKLLHTELENAIQQTKTQDLIDSPKLKEVLLRGLKVLKTTLDSLGKTADAELIAMRLNLANWQKELDTNEHLAKTLHVNLRSTVSRGLAAVQRLKADPTPATYNKVVKDAARDVSAQLTAVRQLAKAQVKFSGPTDPTALATALKPFATGDLMSIAPTTTKVRILELASQLNQAVKAVKAAYGV